MNVITHILYHPSLLVIWPTGSGKGIIELLAGLCLRKLRIANRILYIMPKTIIDQLKSTYRVQDLQMDPVDPLHEYFTSFERLRTWNKEMKEERERLKQGKADIKALRDQGVSIPKQSKATKEAKRKGVQKLPRKGYLAAYLIPEEFQEGVRGFTPSEWKTKPGMLTPRANNEFYGRVTPLDIEYEEKRRLERIEKGEVKPDFMKAFPETKVEFAESVCPEDVGVFVDEGHILRQPQFGETMRKCAERAIRRVVLTATPLINSQADLVNQLEFLLGGNVNIPKKKNFLKMPDDEFRSLFQCRVSMLKETPEWKAKFPARQDIIVEIPMSEKFYCEYKRLEMKQFNAMKPTTRQFFAKRRKRTGLQYRAPAEEKIPNLHAFYNGMRQWLAGGLAIEKKMKGKKVEDLILTAENPRINAILAIIEKESIVINDRRFFNKGIIYAEYIGVGVDVIHFAIDKKFGSLKEKSTEGLVCRTMTQSTTKTERDTWPKEYNKANYNYIIIMSRVGSLGLNFKNTSYVILQPGWNESMTKQVSGRGIRYLSHEDPTKPGVSRKDAIVRVYILVVVKPRSIRSPYRIPDLLRIHPQIWTLNYQNKLVRVPESLPTPDPSLYLPQPTERGQRKRKRDLQEASTTLTTPERVHMGLGFGDQPMSEEEAFQRALELSKTDIGGVKEVKRSFERAQSPERQTDYTLSLCPHWSEKEVKEIKRQQQQQFELELQKSSKLIDCTDQPGGDKALKQAEKQQLYDQGIDWVETLDEMLLERSWQKELELQALLNRLRSVSIENDPGCQRCSDVLTCQLLKLSAKQDICRTP